jgi:hypothetical protein
MVLDEEGLREGVDRSEKGVSYLKLAEGVKGR